MKIAVFLKQVPDTTDVKWTQNNNIDRANMESIINPADRIAAEAALKLKELYDITINAVSMGPKKSIEVLKEAIAMGVDDAILLCDAKFAGSDTCATSIVLSQCIKEKLPDTDLLIFGQSAIDGETGQTGASTAKRLNMPIISNVIEILSINEQNITVISENENEKLTVKIELPAAICVNSNYIYKPRLPKINGYINAHNHNYKIYNLYDLNLTGEETGVKGSPTYVSKIYRNTDCRNCKIYDNENLNIKEIYNEIKKAI